MGKQPSYIKADPVLLNQIVKASARFA